MRRFAYFDSVHLDHNQAVFGAHMDLLRSADGFAVFALTQREGNGGNHGHQQNGSGHLDRHQVLGVQQNTQGFGIGELGCQLPHRHGRLGRFRRTEATHQYARHFKRNQCAQRGCQGEMLPEAFAQCV